MINPLTRILLATSCMVIPAQAALAQTAPKAASDEATSSQAGPESEEDVGVEEIIVTAQKREERLQDVPVAVVAVTGEQLQRSGITRLDDIGASIPNMRVAESFSQGYLAVRGVSSGINPGFESTVGQVIDGFFYPRNMFSRFAFLDMERLEVLKGPQGALFGKNTTAGAINITTNKPSDILEGWMSGTYEFEGDEGYDTEGAISVPLGSTAAVRIAGRYENRNGYLYNTYTNETQPRTDAVGGRISLAWQPTDRLSIALSGSYGDMHNDGRNIAIIGCDANFIKQLSDRNLLQYEDCRPNFNTSENYERPPLGAGQFNDNDTNFYIANATVSLETSIGTISSLTGWAGFNFFGEQTGTRSVLQTRAVDLGEKYDQFSQEIRLISPDKTRFEYILGAYYLATKQDTLSYIHNFGPGFTINTDGHQENKTYAVFGQVTWNITDAFEATVGGRYTREAKDMILTGFQSGLFNRDLPSPVPGPSFRVTPEINESDFSPTFSLAWHPNDDTMIYGSVRKGFKGGSFNHYFFGTAALAETSVAFGDEKVTAFEIGSKLRLADGKVVLNLAAFRSEYKDLQVTSRVEDGQLQSVTFAVQNAAGATSQGAELEVQWRPTRNLRLAALGALLDASYDDFPGAQCYRFQTVAQGCVNNVQDLTGAELPFSADWSGNFSATYDIPLNDDMKIQLFGQFVFTDGYYTEFVGEPASIQDSYTQIHGRIALVAKNWEFAVIGRNLTNQLVFSGVSQNNVSSGGTYTAQIDPPRQIMAQLKLRF